LSHGKKEVCILEILRKPGLQQLMAVGRIRHGVVVTADVRENRPKMKLDNNRIFGNVISFPDGL
jgi:hypothetical protein